MSRIHVFVLAVCMLTATTGCRNRCNNSCGNGLFAGSPTIRGTSDLQSEHPFGRQESTVLCARHEFCSDQSIQIPMRQRQQRHPSLPNRWEPKNGNVPGANGASNSGSTGQSVLTTPTTFVETSPSNPGNYRTASNTALPGSGLSFTDSTNYRTTQVDETRDGSRLPATDASNVRAPASSFPTGNVNRIAQLPQPTAPRYPTTFNSTASVTQPYAVPQNGIAYEQWPASLSWHSSRDGQQRILFDSCLRRSTYRTTRLLRGSVTSSAPTVLAQATTTYDPSSGSQFGWRDRDLNTSSESFNR